MNKYSTLLGVVPDVVAEAPTTYNCLTERHIQALWLEQKYFKNLQTSTGLPIKVVSPGIWNANAGPDFLHAHLVIGGTVVKGDIEIHLNEASWTQHHHHTDPRYNNVVLHLSLWNPHKKNTFQTASKTSFYSAHMESFLSVSVNRLLSLIDLELYPYKKFLGSGRCSQQLFKQLPESKTIDLLNDAAVWRLIQKLDSIKAHTPNPRLWLGAGIAMALGYKRNSTTFLQLYLWLNQQESSEEEYLYALCLKACGFFAVPYQAKWKDCSYYNELLKLNPKADDLPELPLNMLKIRPYNHPVRRLAFLAKLIADFSHYNLSEKLYQLWNSSWQHLNKSLDFSKLRHQFSDLLPNYNHAFLNHHYTFAGDAQPEFLSLIGQHQKQTIITNIFIPLLAENIHHKRSPEEWDAFKTFFASFSAEHTSKTRYLTHRFFGNSPKSSLLDRADLEQGAYQIHKDFCIHYEASCDGCPFVDRYHHNYT